MRIKGILTILAGNAFLFLINAFPAHAQLTDADVQINTTDLGFEIPTFSNILTFLIRFFFVIAGIAALFFMLWGAISWVTSGGDKDNVAAARGKIMSALVGVLIIVATIAIIWSLEVIVFNQSICFGISCPVTLPNLLECVSNQNRGCP